VYDGARTPQEIASQIIAHVASRRPVKDAGHSTVH
jgi:hypothetical protein